MADNARIQAHHLAIQRTGLAGIERIHTVILQQCFAAVLFKDLDIF